MQKLITGNMLIAVGIFICGIASLLILVFQLDSNLYTTIAALIAVGLAGIFIGTQLRSRSIKNQLTELARSIDEASLSNVNLGPLALSEPVLAPITSSLERLLERSAYESTQNRSHAENYLTLLNSMADGLFTVSEKGVIRTVNRAGLRLLGRKIEDVSEQHLSSFIAEPAALLAKSFLESFVKNAHTNRANSSADMIRSDNSHFPARLSVSRLSNSEELLYVVVFNDISEIRSMERKLRSVNLELSKSNERLEKTSITDALTQLYNRRHFDSMFSKEIQRATRSRASLSLIIIDIDFFKQYNDIYGHTAGDDCLKRVASSIKAVFKRSGDLPSRYGGEEFAIILPGCDGLELQERAETMRLEICALEIPHTGSKAGEYVSISIGAVTYKPTSQALRAPKPKDLFSEADKALYRAKARGRDQVVFAGQYQPLQIPTRLDSMYGHLTQR